MELVYPEFRYDISNPEEADFIMTLFGNYERAATAWKNTLNTQEDVQAFIDAVSGTLAMPLLNDARVCIYNSKTVPWGGEGDCMSAVMDDNGEIYIFVDIVTYSELLKNIPEQAYYITYDNCIYCQLAKEGRLVPKAEGVQWDGVLYVDEDIEDIVESAMCDPSLPDSAKRNGDVLTTIGSLALPWETYKVMLLHRAGLVDDLDDDVIAWLTTYYETRFGPMNLPELTPPIVQE